MDQLLPDVLVQPSITLKLPLVDTSKGSIKDND